MIKLQDETRDAVPDANYYFNGGRYAKAPVTGNLGNFNFANIPNQQSTLSA